MSQEHKPTPLPWHAEIAPTDAFVPPQDVFTIQNRDTLVAVLSDGPGAAANAEFIARACNAHDDLLSATIGMLNPTGHTDACTERRRFGETHCSKACAKLRAAITRAGVELRDAFKQPQAQAQAAQDPAPFIVEPCGNSRTIYTVIAPDGQQSSVSWQPMTWGTLWNSTGTTKGTGGGYLQLFKHGEERAVGDVSFIRAAIAWEEEAFVKAPSINTQTAEVQP